MFDLADEPEHFLYNWSELTIQPTEWFRTGLVTQRTRAYQAERDIQRGLLVGVNLGRSSLTTNVFEPFSGSPTVVVRSAWSSSPVPGTGTGYPVSGSGIRDRVPARLLTFDSRP